MTVRFEVTHPKLGPWGVTLPAYKWGYSASNERIYRSVAVNGWGRLFRVPAGATPRRALTVTFRETDDRLDPMRAFTVLVHRYVLDVRFYPNFDTAPSTFLNIDWPLSVSFNRILDNYEEVELQLLERVG